MWLQLLGVWSLAFIGNASAHKSGGRRAARAEAFSIRRQEGSRWRLRRTRHLWRLVALLVPTREAGSWEERRSNWVAARIWLGKWLRGQNRWSLSASCMGCKDTATVACEQHVGQPIFGRCVRKNQRRLPGTIVPRQLAAGRPACECRILDISRM